MNNHLVPKLITDKNGKQTTVKVNPNLDGRNSIDRTLKLGGAPSVAELMGAAPKPSHYVPTRYPHTYGIDFLRGKTELVPKNVSDAYLVSQNETVENAAGSRGAISAVIHLWAETEGIDNVSLFTSLANAYLEKFEEERITSFLYTGYEGIEVEAGYPKTPESSYEHNNRPNDDKLLDLARYNQQFGEDGYLFERDGQVYVDHAAMPVELSTKYWELKQKTDALDFN